MKKQFLIVYLFILHLKFTVVHFKLPIVSNDLERRTGRKMNGDEVWMCLLFNLFREAEFEQQRNDG